MLRETTCSRRIIQHAAYTAFSLLALVACAEPPTTSSDRRPSAAIQQRDSTERPFYYYQDRPIYLDLDPEFIVFDSPLSTAPQVARAITEGLGVSVADVRALPQAPGHWSLHLPPSTTPQVARAVQKALRSDPRFEFVSTAFRISGGSATMLPLNRFGVRFKDGVARAQIDSLNATLGVRILREPSPDSGFVDYWFAYPPGAGSDPLRIAAQYDQHPFVRYAHPDMINETELTSVPTDPYYTFQYYLKNATTYNGINVDINVEPAWNVQPTMGCGAPSAGCVAVAVIDDGVQAAHPDFGGRVAFGYDVFGNNTLGCSGCANNPSNDPSHGTQVAGIILGQHDGQGIAGVAPGARVVPVRMFRPITEGGGASDLQIADGIRFAWYFAEAAVLNNSWDYTDPNYPGNAAVTNAISDAVTQGRGGKGAVVVFAAGNTSDREGGIIGRVAYPARLSTVITVGAIDRSGYITNYSPEGSELDLVAPSGHYVPRFGEECTRGDVVTTDLLEYRGCSDGPSSDRDYTSTFSGTSAAAPQVSGVAALLLAKEPGLTQTQVKSHLQSSADYWGLATKFGAGKINAYQALQTPFTVSISGPTFIDTPGTYTWTANAAGGDGTYSYQWQESTNGSTYFNVGTGKTYSESENSDASFYLRVNVTSAGQTTSKTVHVTVQTSCDPGDMC